MKHSRLLCSVLLLVVAGCCSNHAHGQPAGLALKLFTVEKEHCCCPPEPRRVVPQQSVAVQRLPVVAVEQQPETVSVVRQKVREVVPYVAERATEFVPEAIARYRDTGDISGVMELLKEMRAKQETQSGEIQSVADASDDNSNWNFGSLVVGLLGMAGVGGWQLQLAKRAIERMADDNRQQNDAVVKENRDSNDKIVTAVGG